MQPFNAETDNPRPVAGEDTMQCDRDVARRNTRTATPKTEVSVSPLGEGRRRESEAPCIHASTPYREVRLPEEALASHHARNTHARKRPGERNTAKPSKQTDPRGEGERPQGQQEKGQDPLLR